MDGYPANSSTMTNGHGIRVRSQFKKKINHFRMETVAVVQDIEEENYDCLIETYYKGYPVAEEKRSLKINIYSE